MLNCPEILSAEDKQRLIEEVDRAQSSWLTYVPDLDVFDAKLRKARALAPAEIPHDMISMHSRFEVTDERSGKTFCYTLVFPREQDELQCKLSVLSPLGMAVLGARVGDEVVWMSAAGPEIATIRALLYQPEADQRRARWRDRRCSSSELFLG